MRRHFVRIALAGCASLLLPCPALVLFAAPAKPHPVKPAAVGAHNKTPLGQCLDRIFERPQLTGAVLGAHVLRLDDGSSLYERQADRLLVPASNTKLLTTAAAMHRLGPSYQFRTLIGVAGNDLVVVGGGDPTISGRFTDGDPTVYFRRWAKALRENHLTQFSGDLVVDDSFFDQQFVHPHWSTSDLGRWYAAPIAALAFNDDCVDVRIAPNAKPGVAAKVSLIPQTRYFRIVNRTRTVASAKQHAPRVTRRPGSNVLECDGGVFQRSQPITSWVAVDDPAVYFGAVLREVLLEEGIEVVGGIRRDPGIARRGDFRPRLIHRFPLLPALSVMNKESQNLYAEQILKTIGAEQGNGSWSGGRKAATQALQELGIEVGSFCLDDGSGLSRENRATARMLTQLLATMYRSMHRDQFRQTLSVAGVDGTLSRRLTEDPYCGRVWAKTGSIRGVRSISGYALSKSGEWLAFSLLINNSRASVRPVQDDFCKALVDAA